MRYEKQVVPLRETLLRILGFLSAAIVTALIIIAIAFRFLDSPKEKLLRIQLERLQEQNKVYADQVVDISDRLKQLEKRDNEVYRSIFEADPIPDSARAKQLEKRKELQLVAGMDQTELTTELFKTLNTLFNRVVNQEKSYKEIESMVRNKEKLLASTPAIQPISNKDLNRLSSGFSYRIDPIYKTVKFHTGLDFSAPQGTPIYATAQGVVRIAGNLGNGYGNHVVINHGFGYETLYGHMSKILVVAGQQVKRGEVIGLVGSTGTSSGPHCHYEVIRNGNKINPVSYYFLDLSPAEYLQIIQQSSQSNQSFD